MNVPRFSALLLASSILIPAAAGRAASKPIKLDGYLDFRKPGAVIVDGQRVRKGPGTRFRGSGPAKSFETIPAGFEIHVEGTRQPDGAILASRIEAKANGIAMFEDQVIDGTNQAEQAYLKAGKIVEAGPDSTEQVLGALKTSGPEVDRARRIVDRLLPSYVSPTSVRVYVVDNKEWNAMAMANYSIYVFSGIMKDLDDDELAIVLGHELTHATHEHSRRQAQKSMAAGIAGGVASIGLSKVNSEAGRAVGQTAAALGLTTFNNVYSRGYEDQADRVGLRYVYEAGYDYRKAPGLWRKFAVKYGDGNPLQNFVFGDHSLSSARAAALEREIRNNYSNPKADPPTHAGRR